MISILTPTRNRPNELRRMVRSVFDTAEDANGVEICFYVDQDDELSIPEINRLIDEGYFVGWRVGPRMVLTRCWNELLQDARGELVMQGNDDVVFRTQGWDRMVQGAFDASLDKIIFVHGSDQGMHYERFGAHGVVHKRWVDACGFFIPPYFSSDFGDKWLNDLANELGRRVYLPFVVEHMHFMFKKAEIDRTTAERLARHKRDNPELLYYQKLHERQANIHSLRKVMQYTPEESAKRSRGILYCKRCGSNLVQAVANMVRCQQCGFQMEGLR